MRDYNCTVSRFFEQTGIPVLNSWRAMELCRDKFLTAQRLAHCGIPTPQTIYISPSDTYATVSDILGPTFVVKQLDGSRGRNVFLVSSASEYGQAYEACSHNAVAQEYISYSHGRDIRVWVAGGKAVDAVVRTNPGILTSNYSRGGSAVLFTGDRTEVFPMAEAAAEVCGLAFAGVDILFRPDNSFCVCEVNGNAGFRTLSACGGSNIVRTMLEVAAESILKHRIRHEQQRN